MDRIHVGLKRKNRVKSMEELFFCKRFSETMEREELADFIHEGVCLTEECRRVVVPKPMQRTACRRLPFSINY